MGHISKLSRFAGLIIALSLTSACTPSESHASGLETRDIEYMTHSFGQKKYNAMSGIWSFPNEANWIVLKSGWAYKNLAVAPEDFDVEASKVEEPKRWKKASEINAGRKFVPLPAGTRLDLSVSRPNSSGNGFTTTVTRKGLTLSENGRFETRLSTLSGLTSSGSNISGNSYIIYDKRSGEGREVVGSGQTSTTVSRSVLKDASEKGAHVGEYEIEGFTLTLTYDNGVSVRMPFAVHQGRNKEGKMRTSVILGDSYYFD